MLGEGDRSKGKTVKISETHNNVHSIIPEMQRNYSSISISCFEYNLSIYGHVYTYMDIFLNEYPPRPCESVHMGTSSSSRHK